MHTNQSKIISVIINKMDFTEEFDVTAGTAVEVAIGTCRAPDGETRKCVRKIYRDEDWDYVRANTIKFREVIDKYGPTVYSIDDESKSIIMEYFRGPTVGEVVVNSINPWEQERLDKLRTIITNVHRVLQNLNTAGFCHDEVQLENFVVLDDLDIRLIDFDSIKVYSSPDCTDMERVLEHFTDALEDNIITRRVLADARFTAEQDSIPQVLGAIMSSMRSLGVLLNLEVQQQR